MRALFKLIQKVAPTGTVVLIIGQAGTGKKVAARAIHQSSPRLNEPFMIFESGLKEDPEISRLLFGYMKRQGHSWIYEPGKIEATGSGTLYFDEIAKLDLWGQEQLLSAIQQRVYLPIRGGIQRSAACRFILGTRRNIKVSMEQKDIIDELYTKVNVFPIYLPSLIERSEDIPALTYQFMRRYTRRYDKQIELIEDRLLTRLIAHPWSGNVRELERCVERMVSICENDNLTMDHYQQVMENGGLRLWNGKSPTSLEELKQIKKELRRVAVREVERAFVIDALQRSHGNVTRAATEVGMQRRNFQALMRQYGVKAG